jgi:flagellar biosynthesis protein FlhA
MVTILETLANYATQYKDADVLTEFSRSALARTISFKLSQGSPELEVLTLDPKTEEQLLRSFQRNDSGSVLNLEPGQFEKLVLQLQKKLETTVFNSGSPVLLCHATIRSALKRAVDRFIPQLSIISANEIASFMKVRSLGSVIA